MAIHIDQTLTDYPTPPDSGSDAPTEFNAKSDAFIGHQAVLYLPEITQWSTEANAFSDAMDNVLTTLNAKVSKSPDTKAALIPTGVTSDRPSTPEVGMLRFNTDTGFMEIYDNSSSWTTLNFNSGAASNSLGRIASAIRTMTLVGDETWYFNMLYPIYPEFDSTLHIRGDLYQGGSSLKLDGDTLSIERVAVDEIKVEFIFGMYTYTTSITGSDAEDVIEVILLARGKKAYLYVNTKSNPVELPIAPYGNGFRAYDEIEATDLTYSMQVKLYAFALTDEEILAL